MFQNSGMTKELAIQNPDEVQICKPNERDEMKFVQGERNPRGAKDENDTIYLERSTRDMPHGKVRYSITWKEKNPRSVIASQILSEEHMTHSVIFNKADLVRTILHKDYSDCTEEADELISLLTGAVLFIKDIRLGDIFEKRGFTHVVRFEEEDSENSAD